MKTSEHMTTAFLQVPDLQGHLHILECGEEILMDGKLFALDPLDHQSIQCQGAERFTLKVEDLAKAFFGTMPETVEIGWLIASYLEARCHLKRTLRALQCIQAEAVLTLQNVTPPKLALVPTQNFDAFTHRALQQYDGTTSMTTFLSELLAQPSGVVKAWAAQTQPSSHSHVNSVSLAHREAVLPDQQETSSASQEVQPVSKKRKRVLWTEDRKKQLEEAFMSSAATTVEAVVEEIAERYDWKIGSVRTYVYEMQLSKKKRHVSRISQENTFEAEGQTGDTALFPDVMDEQTAHVTPMRGCEALLCEAQERVEDSSFPVVDQAMREEVSALQEEKDVEREETHTTADGIEPASVVTCGPTHTSMLDGVDEMTRTSPFTWDEVNTQKLVHAYMECSSTDTSSTRAVSNEIALILGLPAEKIEQKIHNMKLRTKKHYRQYADRNVPTQKHENELPRGPYTWTILINRDERAVWQLDYASGDFPQHFQGKNVCYKGAYYRIDRIFNQVLHVSTIASEVTLQQSNDTDDVASTSVARVG